ncbi:succinate-semialdehyde dehydrogenase/glutarate-semialdehyde dehydrogenase [Antricoccus suffuscus]|uniref:Succinate-semialdehyde dehydrogenase/glutarate-semialdehyde dehydrogenase n=1 Tax=Antricoccus suffuscus TaxID=1629062 RepID=A0A2T0ZJS0_9ACTN|nr:NAD-dependent succinate-semialdehyde dehydrogenase [Antricoccus suffuscus]PRZ36592.1 succinate-semialdehyde dehydrogenase/glutarate-semialdehyde dehydrogenase [Antricoccus suffuscus]
MTSYKVVNPATGETVKEYPEATDAEIQDALKRSDEAFKTWQNAPVGERSKVLARVAELYDERKEELARIIGREMGKPVAQGIGEVGIVGSIYNYYSTEGPGLMQDEVLSVSGGGEAVVRSAPLGSLLGIMPWNFPYYQVARFAAPNLMLGNTIILKHAPCCPESALAIEQIFKDAGLPEDAYINVFATNDQAADIIADPRNHGVSLTGSERAGAAVAEVAGRNLKKVVLELGGSDAFIVLDSPDVKKTAKIGAGWRAMNAGQACNAPKRFIVKDDLYDEFVETLTDQFSQIKPGDPLDPKTAFGPLSSQAAADGLMSQIQDAIDKGATVHTGGKPVDRPGAYIEPTVLTDVTPQMRAYSEELFGPAAVVYKVANEDEAVELANSSSYGLGGTVWSADLDKARAVADRLDTGMVFINAVGGTQADLPFGGVKRSGIGRELGKFGMDEFVNKKLVRIPK